MLYTDHKPLVTILGSKEETLPLAAGRFQGWALIPCRYNYKIVFKLTKAHVNADRLSQLRLAMPAASNTADSAAMFNICQVHSLPVTASQLQLATRQVPVFSAALHVCFTQQGWPNQIKQS